MLLVCGYIADSNLSLIVYQKTGRAKCEILVNNLCESLNSKLLDGRDKPIIGCLEYIREYLMKRTVNVQNFIDKCTGPLTPTATSIYDVIKQEATKLVLFGMGRTGTSVRTPGMRNVW